MKNLPILFAIFLHSFLIFTTFYMASPSSFAAATKPISSLGCAADPNVDPQTTARIDSLNPLYVTTWGPCFWSSIATNTDPKQWDWSGADRMVALNYARGRRIIWVAFVNPDWVAGKNLADWLCAYTNYTRAVALRYGDKLWAMQVWNEPTACDPVKQAWGHIPGLTNNTDAVLYGPIVNMYRAVKPTLKGTRIKLAGPAWSAGYWYEATKLLFDQGARGLVNVCIVHDYLGGIMHPDQYWTKPDGAFTIPPADERIRRFRAATGNIPVIVTELGLYGQSSAKHPNTGLPEYNSGFSEQQGIRDAILYAILLRAGGATAIMPHVLTNSSANTNDNIEIAGYEFDDGTAPARVPMKAKTRAFIDTLKLLETLTDAQIKELARLARSL